MEKESRQEDRSVMGPIRPRRLDHFGIEVRDLPAAERFYTEILGMQVEMRLANQVLLRFQDTNLALFARPDKVPAGPEQIENPFGKGHHAFLVGHQDLHEAMRLFRERKIPHKGLIDWGDHDCLYFLDPDGNLLELVGYREESPEGNAS